ncbi:nucleosome assembly protein family [Aureobasidium sp. EXF-3400]|nr:nucleosome assembly protein family [Aureobasidium sp. EXF-12344]KAI4773504.1 nucleosome assembly protein family [Aureobasidium sp. EXF-3400]
MADEQVPVHYEDLALLETKFDEVDRQILAKQYVLSAPLYAKRQEIVSKIDNFWPLVFEQSPPDLDRYITPNDANIFAKLKSLNVTRFEVPMGPEKIDSEAGDPRSIAIRFEFDDNEYFTNSVLEKKFWYRRSNDGWTGLVSEPVKIDWKGKDPTEGLNAAALAVFEARKKAGDMKKKGFPAHNKLLELIETNNVDNTSFFAWFGFISADRYVSAEESAQANKEYKERQDKRSNGERVESPEPDEEDMLEMTESDDVHPEGEELAQLIAEDVWPNAIKYFTQAQEMEDMSEMDFEDLSDEDDDNEPIDLRALVGKGKPKTKPSSNGADEPPKKKQKK